MKAWLLGVVSVAVPSIVLAVACGGGGASTTNGAGGHAGTSSPSTSSSSSGGATGGSSTASSSSSAASTSGSGTSSSGGTGGSSAACSTTDPMTDLKPCGMGCPSGQTCIEVNNVATCYLSCDPNDQATCPCDRYCEGLVGPDGGAAGGGCFPANGEGERCDIAFDKGGCAQDLICARSAGSTKSYCEPLCKTQADCPAHTNCVQIVDAMNNPVAMACAYDYGPNGKAVGSTCGATDACISDSLCDGTCLPQCDGPGGTCATGTCTGVVEGTTTIGYVCK